ncbi:RHS repeat-associated core domain-containing protein [Luteimonas sp. A534]
MVKWVLGQVHRAVCIGPFTALPAGCGGGTEMFKRSYDPTYALPLVTERFGKIEQTLGWNTAAPLPGGQRGTAASVADGNGHATTLADWKHGIPQLITYPATPEAPSGAMHAAHVNDRGWIDWIDDENGSRTCYLYDAMGRISQVTYPSEAAAHTCNTSTWAATTQAFQQVDSTEYGIPAGHWRQTVATGNGRRVSYFDALWRPLVTREYDTANAAGTQRFQRFAYDHEGRTTFASYPATVHNPTSGSWTEYDALGRATSVSQDSEQGLLTTTTLYESGFQTHVTNAENQQTLTRYLAWDQPTTDLPVHITHPEGAFTHIARDVFGKPTLLRRSNHTNPAGGTLAVDRTYAYNPHQELCRSVEPETGATLMGYDGTGNLAWSAAGLPAATACHLAGTTPTISARRVDRTYDARSRLKTLSFPKDSNGNGNGDQAWTYFRDGKPHQISTWNIGVEGGDPKETRNLYGYHRRGLLTTEAIAVPAWYMFLVGHAYDANGHEIKLTYPSGRVVTTAVNALGQPTAITSAGATYASGIGYHPNGAVAGFTYGNGIVHAMAPNARQLPGTVSSVYGAEEFLHDGYAYDRNANVTAIADLRLAKGGARSRTMTYDGLDRLTSVASEMYGPTGANYVYNVLDDLTQVNVGGPTGRNHHYCYNAKRQLGGIRAGGCSGTSLFTLQFDAQGNLQSREPTGGTAQTYRFDFGNRLREVDGVERYRYDGHGRRVLAMQIDAGTVFSQYGLDGRLLYQKSEKTALQTDHVFLGGTLVAIHEKPSLGAGPEPVKYQHTDALGSPVVVTRQDRSRAEESEYEPYGQVINRALRDGPGYTGHLEDAATGLVYMQQRYYDPMLGVFLSADPVTAYSNPVGQFHRYRYASNNPYTRVDPDGRRDIYIGGGGDKNGSQIVQSYAAAQQQLHPDRDIQYFSWRESGSISEAMSKGLADGEPLNVIGHSLGGSQAIKHANDSGATITNLVTIDPVGEQAGNGVKPANTENWVNIAADPGTGDRSDKVASVGHAVFGATNTSGATTSQTSNAHHGYFNTMMNEAKATETIDASYQEKRNP